MFFHFLTSHHPSPPSALSSIHPPQKVDASTLKQGKDRVCGKRATNFCSGQRPERKKHREVSIIFFQIPGSEFPPERKHLEALASLFHLQLERIPTAGTWPVCPPRSSLPFRANLTRKGRGGTETGPSPGNLLGQRCHTPGAPSLSGLFTKCSGGPT